MKRTLFLALAAIGMSTSANAALVFNYQLNGNFNDALGGAAIASQGGTIGASGYSFGPNQGLNVAGSGLTSTYSIETRFSFSNISGFRKIVDFKDRSSDNGLYVLNGALNFFPITTGPSAFVPNQLATVLLTRSAAGDVKGYVNGALAIQFNDPDNLGVFSNNIIRLFQDDFPTGQSEASAGFVDFVKIYDSVILPGAAVPEPASWALMIAGFGLVGGAMRRRTAQVTYA